MMTIISGKNVNISLRGHALCNLSQQTCVLTFIHFVVARKIARISLCIFEGDQHFDLKKAALDIPRSASAREVRHILAAEFPSIEPLGTAVTRLFYYPQPIGIMRMPTKLSQRIASGVLHLTSHEYRHKGNDFESKKDIVYLHEVLDRPTVFKDGDLLLAWIPGKH